MGVNVNVCTVKAHTPAEFTFLFLCEFGLSNPQLVMCKGGSSLGPGVMNLKFFSKVERWVGVVIHHPCNFYLMN
jgi:hypothetical protein